MFLGRPFRECMRLEAEPAVQQGGLIACTCSKALRR